MTKISVNIPLQPATSYPILIGSDLLAYPEKWLPANWSSHKIVIITDDIVNPLYGKFLSEKLATAHPLILSISAGEASKNYQVKHSLQEKMLEYHCDRNTLLLALGGGVIGDLTGYIAATYMRGVSYIQIPTTLLSMVDSSVGGKTGINAESGKNLIGAFWQPKCVVADVNCLLTLSQTQIINGFIEAFKMFLTSDRTSFEYAMTHINSILEKDTDVLKNIIERAVKIKAAVVNADEKESNQRMILNFGHTIGHALEKVLNYEILHGYAVGLGILLEAKISQLLGLLSDEDFKMIQTELLKLNISADQLKSIQVDEIIQATKSDKKVKEDAVRYVLLRKIGEVHTDNDLCAHAVPDEIVKNAWEFFLV